MSINDDDGGTQYMGPDGYLVELLMGRNTGQVIRVNYPTGESMVARGVAKWSGKAPDLELAAPLQANAAAREVLNENDGKLPAPKVMPPTRVIDDNKAVEFLRNQYRENSRLLRVNSEEVEENLSRAVDLTAERVRLLEEREHLQDAIATLKSVSKKKTEGGERHEESQ